MSEERDPPFQTLNGSIAVLVLVIGIFFLTSSAFTESDDASVYRTLGIIFVVFGGIGPACLCVGLLAVCFGVGVQTMRKSGTK